MPEKLPGNRRAGSAALLAVLALSVPTIAADETARARMLPQGGPESPPVDAESAQRDLERERRHRARRGTREGRDERRRSRESYRRLSRLEARRLLGAKHPALLETPVWKPLKLGPAERVDRFYGEHGAIVERTDGAARHAVDSSLPLRSDVGEGPKRLADLSLVDRGSALEPENPLVATRIAKALDGGVQIGGDGFGLRLVSPSGAQAELVGDRAFFAGALADSDLVVMPTPMGVELSIQVRSPEAPEEAVLAFDLPEGSYLRVVDDVGGGSARGSVPGSAEVIKAGKVLSVIHPPAGWDADQEPLEGVRYSVDGDKLVLHYPHRSADISTRR